MEAMGNLPKMKVLVVEGSTTFAFATAGSQTYWPNPLSSREVAQDLALPLNVSSYSILHGSDT